MTLFNNFLLITIVALCANLVSAQTPTATTPAEIYKTGNYSEAIKVLKKTTKAEPSNADAWFYLGMSYLGAEKDKDAQKALERAVSLNKDSEKFHLGLAYLYLVRRDGKAAVEANAALTLNPNNADAHWVLGVVAFRRDEFNVAYERANKAIAINPGLGAAYLLKSESLTGSFGAQSGTVIKDARARYELLKEGSLALEKYLELAPPNSETQFYTNYLESLKSFAEYYEKPENQRLLTDPAGKAANKTPLKILSKPRPSYTDRARMNNVQGTILLLVSFTKAGQIGNILILKGLDSGLNQNAIRAARAMKFQPATEAGVPITATRQVEYSFSIY